MQVSVAVAERTLILATLSLASDGGFRDAVALPDIPAGTYQLRVGAHCAAPLTIFR